MKSITQIFILSLSMTAQAISSHKEYALYFEQEMNKRLTHGKVLCYHDEMGFYKCTLKRNDNATDDGYDYDYKYARAHLDRVNKTIWKEHKVPELYIWKE